MTRYNKFEYKYDDIIISYLILILPFDLVKIVLNYMDKYHTDRDIELAVSFNNHNDMFWDDIYYMANKQMIIIHDWCTFNHFRPHLVYQHLNENKKLYINHNLFLNTSLPTKLNFFTWKT